jgi:DNA-binding transcriptional MerR regulator
VRIGELAKAAGTTTRALRFYEEHGLLTAGRAVNGYRVYDEGAVNRVANIRFLLDAGLTLDDVAHFRVCLDGDLPNSRPTEAMLGVGLRRLAVLDERIADLVRVRDHLATMLTEASAHRAVPVSH